MAQGKWPEERPVEYIDSHCHLGDAKFAEDLPAVLERAAMVGVRRMLVIADSLPSSRRALELAGGDARLRATAGVHPHNAKDWNNSAAAALEAMLDEYADAPERLAALGEVGLDYYYGFSAREAQLPCFRAQIALARAGGLPLVIHVRDAFEDFLQVMEEERLGEIGGVVHCFSGTVEDARRVADAGLHIGIGGILTFKRSETLRQVVRSVPPESLLLETDAPYLAPEPHRGKRNEPALLVHVAERLAAELGLSEAELSELTRANTLAMLKLKDWPLE